jgi:hypothetical protein
MIFMATKRHNKTQKIYAACHLGRSEGSRLGLAGADDSGFFAALRMTASGIISVSSVCSVGGNPL